jgi:prepilin-type N-terminal cleavage/methylation domain-containing protein
MTTDPQKGFSLLELIIAIGVFSIAAIFAIASLLSLIDAQKRASATQDAMDNNPCGTFPCSNFQFKNDDDIEIEYRWQDEFGLPISVPAETGVIGKAKFGASPCDVLPLTCFNPLTDSKIRITSLDFYVVGEGTGDDTQPFVTIAIEAIANEGLPRREAKVFLQTTISQRRLDS